MTELEFRDTLIDDDSQGNVKLQHTWKSKQLILTIEKEP
jgi:hypothetical protein